MLEAGTEIWRLATALSGAGSPLDVAIALAEEGAAAAGAQFSNMAVRDGRIWVIHGAGLDPDAADRWAVLDPAVGTPLADAISSGEPVLLDTVEAIAARYPDVVDDTVATGLMATASWPLLGADGVALGAVGFGWTGEQIFDQEQRRRLHLITQMASSALERAQLHERHLESGRQREEAEAQLLQDIFLPRELPIVEHLELAAVYLPASDAPMGGDWYDAFPVDGGTCFVIGDVAGHGLQAAAVMGLLRNATRAYAVEHPAPAQIVDHLNRMLCHLEPTETASAIVLTWDPSIETIIRTNAGHPPILRCRPGESEYLEPVARGPLLGVDPHATYDSEPKQLRAGTTLLFYTDGLIEQRGQSLTDGMDALLAHVEKLDDLAPQALCDAVLEWRLGYGSREDDICILAVRLA